MRLMLASRSLVSCCVAKAFVVQDMQLKVLRAIGWPYTRRLKGDCAGRCSCDLCYLHHGG